jgi:isoquinoline 1-oxidoreductase beta subunit
MSAITRRDFVRTGLALGGGLFVWVPFSTACSDAEGGTALEGGRFGIYLRIDGDGITTITIPVPEIGQGVRTSLAMLVAEELDADWERIAIVQADAADELGGRARAAGSQAIREHWMPLREAGAVARALLVSAAAARWGVSPQECRTESGRVISGRRSVAYGDVASEAAALSPPADVALRDPSRFTIIGTDRRHLDAPAITRGEATFGLDVRVPGMLRAVVERAPVYGGRVRSVDDAAARAVPGVRDVLRLPPVGDPDRPAISEGVAVVADRTWTALSARRVLSIEWDDGPHTGESTARLHDDCRARIDRPGDVYREDGAVDRAFASAARTVEAVYHTPFLTHAQMEPMNCVVHVRDGGCEIWAPTQIPLPVRSVVADRLGVPRDAVTVHVTRVGGGFGRRLGAEFVLEALEIARNVDAPVQVVWTREDDMRNGFMRPFNYHRLRAALDDAGSITAWLHRQAGTSRYAFRDGEHPGDSEFRPWTLPAMLLPAYRLEYSLSPSALPRGPLRAPGINAYTFAAESFIDEIANAAGRDPLELRLDLLREDRRFAEDEDDEIETSRMRHVLERVAETADWGSTLPAGRGRGIASSFTFGSYAAHVIEVDVDDDGALHVRRAWSAIDCGRAVNPNGVRAQVEGGLMDGLSAALHGEITVEGGRIVQSNFHDYPLLRLSEAPSIEEITVVASDRAPTGAGEPPYPPVAPALANAIFAASGARVRTLPVRPGTVSAALSARGAG